MNVLANIFGESHSKGKDSKEKFYSIRTIIFSTLIGSPLAAGILLRRNFISLGKSLNGIASLLMGIALTILLIYLGINIPENSIWIIPLIISPFIYTTIIYYIFKTLQSKLIEEQLQNESSYFSVWRSVGVVAFSIIILYYGSMSYVVLSDNPTQKFDIAAYNSGMESISKYEEEALKLYEFIDTCSAERAIQFIENKGLPNWENSIQILNILDKMSGLTNDLIEQNKILRNYCSLRIESYELIRKGYAQELDDLAESTKKLNELYNKIDLEVEKLNAMNTSQ